MVDFEQVNTGSEIYKWLFQKITYQKKLKKNLCRLRQKQSSRGFF